MDYTSELNVIISKLNDLIDKFNNSFQLEELLFLILAIFLVIYVMRGE